MNKDIIKAIKWNKIWPKHEHKQNHQNLSLVWKTVYCRHEVIWVPLLSLVKHNHALLYRHRYLLENTPLIKFIQNCIQSLHPESEWHIFHICTIENIDDVISHFSLLFVFAWFFVYIIKRTYQPEGINFMFLWREQYLTCSLHSLVRYCSCNENTIHIFSPPCNVLYVLYVNILDYVLVSCPSSILFSLVAVQSQA